MFKHYTAEQAEPYKKFIEEEIIISKRTHSTWLLVALALNNMQVVNKLMQAYEVPDNLTLKEQLCWLQLLSEI